MALPFIDIISRFDIVVNVALYLLSFMLAIVVVLVVLDNSLRIWALLTIILN